MNRILTITAAFILCFSASAQNRPEGAPDNKDGKGPRPGFEQIESMKVAFFTSELDLSPEEASKFWPIYNQYFKELRDKGHLTRTALQKMEEMNRVGKSSDIEYKKAVDSYIDAKAKENEVLEMYLSEFYKVLSPEKVSRMLVAEERFRFKMIDMWYSHKRPDRPQEGKRDDNGGKAR